MCYMKISFKDLLISTCHLSSSFDANTTISVKFVLTMKDSIDG